MSNTQETNPEQQIRSGELCDVDCAPALILQAAPELLTAIFAAAGPADKQQTQTEAFLRYAWQQPDGQYSHKRHLVVCKGQQVVGVMTLWQANMPTEFAQQTITAIHDYYGVVETMEIVKRSQFFTASLPSPKANECILGHLAVAPKARRLGVGKKLVAHARGYAGSQQKSYLLADVQKNNVPSIAFYQDCGFKQVELSDQHFIRMQLETGFNPDTNLAR